MHEHISTFKNFVSPIVCQAIREDVDASNLYEQGILDNKGENIERMKTIVDREARYVMCGTKFNHPELINSVIQSVVENFIEPRYLCTVQYWEWPQLLIYPEDGGHYKPHVDGEYYYVGDGWKRITNRDITLLLYLDDDYDGGEVIFPDYGMMIKPSIGQIITFPSNRNFRHGVNPVTKGYRRVLVCWLTIYGSQRAVAFPPPSKHVIRGEYPAIKIVND